MSEGSPALRLGAALAVALIVVGLYLYPPAVLRSLDLGLYDLLLRLTHRGQTSDRIVVVDLDQRSLSEVGRWPWPRSRLATLLHSIRAQAPTSIALDMMFPEPDDPASDRALGEVLSAGPFVVGQAFTFSGDSAGRSGCALRPVAVVLRHGSDGSDAASGLFQASGAICTVEGIAVAAPGAGFLNAVPDRDGIFRRAPLLIAHEGRMYPSLSLAALLQARGFKDIVLDLGGEAPGWLHVGDVSVPIDARGNLLVQFRGRRQSFPYVSAADVLAGRLAPGTLRGRIVFVGSSALGNQEVLATPLGPLLPGVEMHATVADNILRGDFLRRPSWAAPVELSLVVALALASGWLLTRLRALGGTLCVAAVGVVLWVAGAGAMAAGTVISVLFPTLALAGSFAVVTTLNAAVERRRAERGIRGLATAGTVILDTLTSLGEVRGEKERLDQALGASEARYRNLVQNAAEGIFTARADGRFAFVNPAMASMFGYASPEEMVGTALDRELYAVPGTLDAILFDLDAGKSVSQFECRRLRKDGTVIWVAQSVRAVRDASGTLRDYEGVVTDVSERKRAEATAEALRRTAHALNASLDPDVVGRLVVESVCHLLGARASAVYRLDPDSGAFEALALFTAEDGAPAWPARIDGDAGIAGLAVLAVRERREVAVPDVLADPRVVFPSDLRARLEDVANRSLVAVPLVRDRVFGVLLVADSTGRTFGEAEISLVKTLAEQAALALDNARLHDEVRQARDFLESIARNSADAIVTTDTEGMITYFSPGAEAMLGYPAHQAIGRAARDFFVGEGDVEQTVMATLETEGRMINYETRVVARDGRHVEVNASLALLRDAAGKVTGTVGVLRDVTEHKRAEATLRQTEKLSIMGSLLAGVAHELNNPLSVVKGHAALLVNAAADGPFGDRARKIDEAADRCSRIVGSFLGLARQRPIEHRSIALEGVVRDALELLAYPLRADGVDVTVDLDRHVPPLWADPNQIHQVLVNIVSNAHQAMRDTPPPRRLSLTSRLHPGRQRIELTVSDTGPGVPPEMRPRLFEPFFTTKPVGLGTGLGLSICLGIVERHGGTIRLEDRADGQRGAAFVIELPVGAGADPAPTAPVGPAPRIEGKTVLVVDDDAAVGEILKDILSVDRHRVERVANGRLALDRLAEAHYDVIVSDVRMPDLDGRGLYEALKGRSPHLIERLVFVTGDSLDAATLSFLDKNAVPLLHKPVAIGDLLETVQSVLRR